MASTDDVNSTLQGVTRNVGLMIRAQQLSASYAIGATISLNTLTTTSIQVLAAAVGRSGIVFHNPSDTIPMLLAPATDASGNAIAATFALRGGAYLLLPQSYLAVSGSNCQLAWNAVSSTGPTNPITIATF
jgi:hypothetical protein